MSILLPWGLRRAVVLVREVVSALWRDAALCAIMACVHHLASALLPGLCMMPGCPLLTQRHLPLPRSSQPAKKETMSAAKNETEVAVGAGCQEAGANPAVQLMKGLAYPWLWAGKKVKLVKQETIDDFYSPGWRPGSKTSKEAESK